MNLYDPLKKKREKKDFANACLFVEKYLIYFSAALEDNRQVICVFPSDKTNVIGACGFDIVLTEMNYRKSQKFK